MALSDLLWACPACGEDRGLGGRQGDCRACGTRFARGPGASIRAVAADGSETVRSVAEWLECLPPVGKLLENQPIRTATVLVQRVTGEAKVFGETGYLNRVELFGEDEPARIRLEADRLVVEREEEGEERLDEGRGREAWPLEKLTAVQASSNTLQLKRKRAPLVAIRFQDDSVYLWEHLLRAALRDFYGRTGRGDIREFQPRIEVR